MRRLTIALTLTLCAAAVGGARAATPAAGTIAPGSTLLTWEGGVTSFTAPPPIVSEGCDAGLCDAFTFTIALGEGYWSANPGAIEVAILWAPYDGETDLDVYVFDAAGNPVAQGAGVDSNAESVFLPALDDGVYTARVVASTVQGFPKPYRGLVQVEPARAPGDGDELLPNLVALPPTNFHIATTPYHLLPSPENPLVSCYPEETIENESHPTRCLRFNQIIANTGEGPLELRFDIGNVASTDPADQQLLQRIHTDDGSFEDVPVDTFEFHPVHGHVHYRGFGRSKLYPYTWGVGRTGDGAPARTGSKVGFCLIDVMLLDGSIVPGLDYWAKTGNAARNHTFPTCNLPSDAEGTVVMGIDVGWADVYGWNLADQYVDITGLADGVYELEQLANPNGLDDTEATPAVVEASYGDNTASTIVCIEGDTVTAVTSADEAAACAGPSI